MVAVIPEIAEKNNARLSPQRCILVVCLLVTVLLLFIQPDAGPGRLRALLHPVLQPLTRSESTIKASGTAISVQNERAQEKYEKHPRRQRVKPGRERQQEQIALGRSAASSAEKEHKKRKRIRPPQQKHDNHRLQQAGTLCDTPASIAPVQHSLAPDPSLRRYAALHAAARSRLLLHLRDPSVAPPRVLIYRCPADRVRFCGGLGDRLRGIRFAAALAVLTRRALFVHVPADPFALTAALRPAAVDWTLPRAALRDMLPAVPTELYPFAHAVPAHQPWHLRNVSLQAMPLPRGAKVSTKKNKKKRKRKGREAGKVHVEAVVNLLEDDVREVFDALPDVLSISTLHSHGALTHMLRANDRAAAALAAGSDFGTDRKAADRVARGVAQMLFRPSPAVASAVDQLLLRGVDFGVHVRAGKGLSEGHLDRFSGPRARPAGAVAKALLQCAEAARGASTVRSGREARDSRERGHSNQRRRPMGRPEMFVAADTAAYRGAVVDLARAAQWGARAASAVPYHISNINFGGERRLGARERCRRFLGVFVDLEALSRARVIIGTPSGFSHTAFLHGHVEELRRVALDAIDKEGNGKGPDACKISGRYKAGKERTMRST